MSTVRGPCPRCDRGPHDQAMATTADERGTIAHCHRCHYWRSTWRGACERLVGDEVCGAEMVLVTDPDGTTGECPRCRGGPSRGGKVSQLTELTPRTTAHAEPLEWSERAEQIWRRTLPLGTIAETYLRQRGCVLPPADGDLRYLAPSDRYPPALCARITDAITARPISLHFTRLAADGSGKAGTDQDKVLLARHRKAGGCIRLWPDEYVTTGLAIAEGIETALAAAHVYTPVWATVDALEHLETERGNGISTRNARLAALHTFARHLGARCPEQLGRVQSVLNIPFKRGARQLSIEYPEGGDIQTLMSHIDRRTPAGQCDYALFALMFNTGARVQEVLNLRVKDLRLDPPEQVRLHGKGDKIRLCPLWPRTARLLQDLIQAQLPDGSDLASAPVFRNRSGASLTRFGVRYLLRKHLPEYRSASQGRRIHPHALRHATAVHLLKSGVEFATISQLLGHASLTTTMRYARADLDLKRQALSQVFPDALGVPAAGRVRWHGAELTRWLRRL